MVKPLSLQTYQPISVQIEIDNKPISVCTPPNDILHKESSAPQHGGSLRQEAEPAAAPKSPYSSDQNQREQDESNLPRKVKCSLTVRSQDTCFLFLLAKTKPDFDRFCTDIKNILEMLANKAKSDEASNFVLPAFLGVLDRLVQSNKDVVAEAKVELFVQVVQNPRGGGK